MPNTNENEKKTKSLSCAIRARMSLPSDALFGESRIEMRGREMLFVSGCRRIIKYSPSEIIFELKGFFLSVRGSGLICTTYHYGSVTVEGRICAISFEEEEK